MHNGERTVIAGGLIGGLRDSQKTTLFRQRSRLTRSQAFIGTVLESRKVRRIFGTMRGCGLPRIWPCCEPHQINHSCDRFQIGGAVIRSGGSESALPHESSTYGMQAGVESPLPVIAD